jgi:altronate hydrolase
LLEQRAGHHDLGRSTGHAARSWRLVVALGEGRRTRSEALGHQEFTLIYKSFAPLGPGGLP